MMENINNKWYALSDTALLVVIGGFIRETRLTQNKTQQQVAEAAGINRSTLVQIEKGGGGTLLTFIQVLRVIDQLHIFDQFEIRQQISPLKLAKLQQARRQRANRQKQPGKLRPKSDW